MHTPRRIAVAMLGLGALLSACGDGGPGSSPVPTAVPIQPPTTSERQDGMSNDVPGATQLTNVTISGGVATVDLSSQFVVVVADQGRVAQVVHTLTRFATVQRVTILLDGKPTTHIGVVNTSVSLTRASVEQWAPAILVEAPTVGAPPTPSRDLPHRPDHRGWCR